LAGGKMIFLIPFGTYGLICLIIFLFACFVFIFGKTSKKQHREYWATHYPDMPPPYKYRYDPNDPDDDKPKMGSLGKAIIGILIAFVVICMSVIGFGLKYPDKFKAIFSPNEGKGKVIISYNEEVYDKNDIKMYISFTMYYEQSPEKVEKYRRYNPELKELVINFFRTKDGDIAYNRHGNYLKDKVIKNWRDPLFQQIRELFDDETIHYSDDDFFVQQQHRHDDKWWW
jgi:hypothetical protein